MRILLIFLISCNQYSHRDHNREKIAKNVAIASLVLNSCQNGSSNSLFASSYYPRYSADTVQYSKIILGDSTADLWCQSYGIVTAGTGCFPVSGNKIEDFDHQLCVLNDKSPGYIFISTMGGNNLLAGQSDSEIIQRGKNFTDSLNTKFPNAVKIWVQVHPTQNDYANAHRGATNSGIASYVQSKGWKVENPDPCFQVDSSGRALSSYMLDSIHPNKSTDQCIQNKILSDYGVTF